jgi:hypothetical protein
MEIKMTNSAKTPPLTCRLKAQHRVWLKSLGISLGGLIRGLHRASELDPRGFQALLSLAKDLQAQKGNPWTPDDPQIPEEDPEDE